MIPGLLLAVVLHVAAANDSIYGTVRVAAGGEVVPGVVVRVVGRAQAALSDSAGRYVVRDLLPGRQEIQFDRVGFRPQSVHIQLDGALRLDVDLAPVPVPLPPVTVDPLHAGAERAADDRAAIGMVHLSAAAAQRDPLIGEPEVFEALQTAPFVQGREELAPSLHVRGGSGDENLVLLDGLPWHGPRPLGGIAGLLPTGAVAGVDVHTAAPPARFGGSLSSVVDVHPAVGDHLRLSGSMEGASIEQTVSGRLPIMHAQALVSVRSTYRSVFDRPDGAAASENGFHDALLHLVLPLRQGSVGAYYVHNSDRLTFPASPDSADQTNRFTSSAVLAGIVAAFSVRGGATVQIRAWRSDVASSAMWDPARLTSTRRDVGLNALVTGEKVEAGFTLSRTVTGYRVAAATPSPFALNGTPLVAAVFASRHWMPAPFWTVSTGLRLAAPVGGAVQPEPRLWTRFDLGARVTAALGYARTHQYVQSARNEESMLDAVVGIDLPITMDEAGKHPARADQLTAELAVRLGEHSSIAGEAYARNLTGVALVSPGTGLPFADGPIASGREMVRGANATFAMLGRRLDAHATIGVLYAMRRAGPYAYRASDDALHARLGVGYRISAGTAARLALHVAAGRPTTGVQGDVQLDPYAPLDGAGSLAGSPVTLAGRPNDGRLPVYARVDLGLSKDWAPLGDSGPWFTTAVTITNLLDRQNVLAYVVSPTGPRPISFAPRTVAVRLRWSFGSSHGGPTIPTR